MKSILEQIKNILVLTIAVRGVEFLEKSFDLLGEYLELTQTYTNFTFCIVAGHPAYEDSIDTQTSSIKSFHKFFKRIREITDIPLFLGAENLSSDTINRLCNKYNPIMPFLLHGDKRAVRENRIQSPFAVYSPLIHTIPHEQAIQAVMGYLLRRRTTQQQLIREGLSSSEILPEWDNLSKPIKRILHHSFDQYVLNSSNFRSRIKIFSRQGAQLIVGHPIVSENFNDLTERFKFEIEI